MTSILTVDSYLSPNRVGSCSSKKGEIGGLALYRSLVWCQSEPRAAWDDEVASTQCHYLVAHLKIVNFSLLILGLGNL